MASPRPCLPHNIPFSYSSEGGEGEGGGGWYWPVYHLLPSGMALCRRSPSFSSLPETKTIILPLTCICPHHCLVAMPLGVDETGDMVFAHLHAVGNLPDSVWIWRWWWGGGGGDREEEEGTYLFPNICMYVLDSTSPFLMPHMCKLYRRHFLRELHLSSLSERQGRAGRAEGRR